MADSCGPQPPLRFFIFFSSIFEKSIENLIRPQSTRPGPWVRAGPTVIPPPAPAQYLLVPPLSAAAPLGIPTAPARFPTLTAEAAGPGHDSDLTRPARTAAAVASECGLTRVRRVTSLPCGYRDRDNVARLRPLTVAHWQAGTAADPRARAAAAPAAACGSLAASESG
jgi:hypothetical protein